MTDILTNLPTDNTPPKPEEKTLIDSLLSMTGESSQTTSKFSRILKATLIITSIFILLGSPWVSDLVKKIPGFSNSFFALMFQAIIFMIITGLSLWLLSR